MFMISPGFITILCAVAYVVIPHPFWKMTCFFSLSLSLAPKIGTIDTSKFDEKLRQLMNMGFSEVRHVCVCVYIYTRFVATGSLQHCL